MILFLLSALALLWIGWRSDFDYTDEQKATMWEYGERDFE